MEINIKWSKNYILKLLISLTKIFNSPKKPLHSLAKAFHRIGISILNTLIKHSGSVSLLESHTAIVDFIFSFAIRSNGNILFFVFFRFSTRDINQLKDYFRFRERSKTCKKGPYCFCPTSHFHHKSFASERNVTRAMKTICERTQNH